ncbi:MAG: tRNA-specific adenosine deaminase subunit tad3 [Pycnora praestabilis]|nr:MAG: tRNA-specific adenosine deaminase subunit tad3 [Pycnora praestabilis]
MSSLSFLNYDGALKPTLNIIGTEAEAASRPGQLIPLKTKAEKGAATDTVDVYIVAVPPKAANTILKYSSVNFLRLAIPEQNGPDLQHLRRFAKPEYLPEHLKSLKLSNHDAEISPGTRADKNGTSEELDPPNSTPIAHAWDRSAQHLNSGAILYLLICTTSIITLPDLRALLRNHSPFVKSDMGPSIRTIPVPLYPPTSEEQAKGWSKRCWPTVYKRSNPFGPHPSIVSHAEEELRPQVGRWMALAGKAAAEVKEAHIGEGIGAVIVESRDVGGMAAVAIAGDARWCQGGPTEWQEEDAGNVMGHAVMRAIGMVARKRLHLSGLNNDNSPISLFCADERLSVVSRDSVFLDTPLTDVEKSYSNPYDLTPGGYLCLGLDIYITHEPCIMCSMALLHSRFGRMVFGTRMPQTGGLTSETATRASDREGHKSNVPPYKEEQNGIFELASSQISGGGLGYGLFWRPELNWKMLAWQWEDEHTATLDVHNGKLNA